MPGEAQKAFDYLKENVPSWLASLGVIRVRLVATQDEIKKVAAPVTPAVIRRKRSGSMESLRPDEGKTLPSVVDLPASQQPIPASAQSAAVAASPAAKRKRNAASLISGRLSGAFKYRSRRMVVVHYDGEIQKAFELLVRNIGTGRNFLRKGKMAAKMDALSASMSMSGESDDSSTASSDSAEHAMGKIGYRPKATNFRMVRSPRAAFASLRPADASSDNFDTADKDLEKAQLLCERGAHQYLRDGDCVPELDSCIKHFTRVLQLAEMHATNKAKEEEAKASRPRVEQEKLGSRDAKQVLLSPPRTNGASTPEKRISYHRSNPIELEVDDEEDLDEPSLEPFRAPLRLTGRV